MHGPVSEIMTRDVFSVDSEDTIEKVEAKMNSRQLSFVPVSDSKGNIFGILSALQIENFRAAKTNPKAVKAWEICTFKPLQVDPNAPIMEVARLMVQNHAHYVVVTQDRAVLGVVSSLDLVSRYLLKGNS